MAKIATATSTKELIEVWRQHCHLEFVREDAKAALGTRSDNPYVLMVPLAIGGKGREGVYTFYHDYFLAQLPADMTAVPISQAVGENILAEEAVYQFTHGQATDWLVPGVPLWLPTSRSGSIVKGMLRRTDMTLGETLHTQPLRDPGATVLVCEEETISYGELDTRVPRANGQPWRRWLVVILAWVGIFAVVLLGLIVCSAAAVGLLVRHVRL